MTHNKKLRGMTWSDPRGYDPLIAASRAFSEINPDVEISWDKRSLQEFESTPVHELARNYDLIIIDHPHVGAIVAQDCLLALDQFDQNHALPRLAGETIGKSFQSYFYHSHQWAIPVDAACQVQAIRPDLLDKPAQGFGDVLKEAKEGHVLWPLRSPHILMSFFSLMANVGTPFPVTQNTPIDQDVALRVLEAMGRLAKYIDPTCFEMDPIAALDALSNETRFSLCPFVYLYAPYGRPNYRPGRIEFHDMPSLGISGPIGSALGGTGLAVSAQTSHRQICCDFAFWVGSSEIQRGLYAACNGQPANALAWADSPVNQAVNMAYAQTRLTHEAAWLRPRHDGYMAFQEDASEILRDVLIGKTTAQKALPALQNRFDESF